MHRILDARTGRKLVRRKKVVLYSAYTVRLKTDKAELDPRQALEGNNLAVVQVIYRCYHESETKKEVQL